MPLIWMLMKFALRLERIFAPRPENIGVLHGRWGEDVAARSLRREGLEIFERNARPSQTDRRLEIDIVAYDPRAKTLVFVEVKQHSSHLEVESRFRGIDDRKRRNLSRAIKAWQNEFHWPGPVRFDVVEVFGGPKRREPPEIDHIVDVSLKPRRRRR